MKKAPVFSALSAFLFFALAASAAWAAPMQPGKWLVTTKTEMPGSSFATPQFTHVYCYSKEDIKGKKTVPGIRKGCDMPSYKTSGDTVSWKMVCKGKGGAETVTGRMTSTGTAYNGTMEMTMPGGRTMITRISGTRLGDCVK